MFTVYIIQLFINDMNINNSIMYRVLLSGIIAFPIFNNVEKGVIMFIYLNLKIFIEICMIQQVKKDILN